MHILCREGKEEHCETAKENYHFFCWWETTELIFLYQEVDKLEAKKKVDDGKIQNKKIFYRKICHPQKKAFCPRFYNPNN